MFRNATTCTNSENAVKLFFFSSPSSPASLTFKLYVNQTSSFMHTGQDSFNYCVVHDHVAVIFFIFQDTFCCCLHLSFLFSTQHGCRMLPHAWPNDKCAQMINQLMIDDKYIILCHQRTHGSQVK